MNKNKKNLYEDYKIIFILKEIYFWVKDNLDVNYFDRLIFNYFYMVNVENVEEVCKFIFVFGIGIKNFKMVDVLVEKVINKLLKFIKDKLMSDLEKRRVEIKKEKDIEKIVFIMRSNKDFFILNIDNN